MDKLLKKYTLTEKEKPKKAPAKKKSTLDVVASNVKEFNEGEFLNK